MKIIKSAFLTVMMTLLVIGNTHAQNYSKGEVPAAVQESFQKKYAATPAYKWDYKKYTNFFKAKFIKEDLKYEAYFKPDGEWVETKREIKKWDLPKPVLEAIFASDYASWEIDDIDQVANPSYDLIYKVEVEMEQNHIEKEVYLYILPTGKIVKEEPKK